MKYDKKILKIRKKWNKYLQKEMMWFLGIHHLHSPRAELSSQLFDIK